MTRWVSKAVINRTLGIDILPKYLEYFFTEKDAAFFKSLGLNCIRIPFNYRHFEGKQASIPW